MKLEIKVRPNSKQEKIQGPPYEVWVKEKPEKGRANMKVLELLSKHFSVSKSKVRIVRGKKSNKKLIEIDF